ncbi:MAG: M48 family metalloprotease [Pyrinomonadaceae bacterium]
MKYLRRFLLIVLSLAVLGQLALPFSTYAIAKEAKIRGYVTALSPPNVFEIEDYKIIRGANVRLELDKPSGASAAPEDLKIGSLVEVRGLLNDRTGELSATKIKLLRRSAETIDATAILEEHPSLEAVEGDRWRGTIVADGRRIQIEPTTAVSFKLNKTEVKLSKDAEKAAKAEKSEERTGDVDPDESDLPTSVQAEGSTALTSLKEVLPGVIMTYRGTEQTDGSVLASQVVFVKNEQENSEYELWREFVRKVKPANSATGAPAELRIGDAKCKISPNADVQAYVNRVGQSLIPAYQAQLREGDPNKIPFRFTVVMEKGFNSTAYPNGEVVINDEVFTVLENEAQLAALLAHEMAHATQEHTYRLREYHKKGRKALQTLSVIAAIAGDVTLSDQLDQIGYFIVAGYGRPMENQADRIGMQYMVAAGYDPSEAPKVWKLIERRYGESNNESYWSGSQNNLERRSFQLLTIRNLFADTDFDKLKKNEAEYKRNAEAAIAANPKIKRR